MLSKSTYSFSLFAPSPGIQEITSISELDVSSFSGKNSIIAFDIDLTLIDYEDAIMKANATAKEERKKFITALTSQGETALVDKMFEKAKSGLVEDAVLSLLHQLQTFAECKIIAFTVRRTGKPSRTTRDAIEDATIALLEQVGIDFSGAFPEYENISLNSMV